MTEELSYHNPFPKEYIQISVSCNPKGLIVQLTTFYQRESELIVNELVVIHSIIYTELAKVLGLAAQLDRSYTS